MFTIAARGTGYQHCVSQQDDVCMKGIEDMGVHVKGVLPSKAFAKQEGTPTSMHTEDPVFYGGSQGQPVEEAVEALPGPDALLLP